MGDTLPTPAQVRAGRAWLGWSRPELAHRAGCCLSIVGRVERDSELMTGWALERVARALRRAGLRFEADAIRLIVPQR